MKLLFDTDVILDILLEREGFFENSFLSLKSAIQRGDRLFFPASSVTDIYCIVRKSTKSKEAALDSVNKLAELFTFAEVNHNCIFAAANSVVPDFEDAVLDEVGQNIDADFLITRNVADFAMAKTAYLSPSDFVAQYRFES